MQKQVLNNVFHFIRGGGEMGALIRGFDWSQSSLGTPEQWPLSLRTALGIVLNSGFPMFLYWGEDGICFYNDASSLVLSNAGKHPAIGKTYKEISPEIWDIVGMDIRRVLETGEPMQFEDRLFPLFRNGKRENQFWTFSYSPVFDVAGKVDGVLISSVETTEKIQAVHKLRESENRFQNLVQEATVGIVVLTDENMTVEIVNEAFGKLINKSADELIGKPLFDVIPESEPYFRQVAEKARTKGESFSIFDQPYSVSYHGNRKDGFLNIVCQPHQEPNGKEGVMALCQDVTEQVIAQKKMEESEQRARSIVESAPFPIGVYIGREMRINLANQAIIDVWGKGNDVIGKLYSEILPELDNQEIFGQLDHVFTQGKAFHARNQRVDIVVDGRLQSFYFNYSFTPLFDSEGQVYGVMNTAAEVTDQVLARHKIEEIVAERTKELAEANSNLQRSNAELAQFAYIASHDLQEPVRKVSTFAQMLETNLQKTDERSLHYVSKIKDSAGRMLVLIRDVLAYSQLSKKAEMIKAIQLGKVIEEVKSDLDLLIEQKMAEIIYNDLPVIEGVPLQILQLFANLITNALKFSRKDVSPVISISCTVLEKQRYAQYQLPFTEGTYYNLEVKDNGIGFRQEHAEQIFNIFQRLHGKKEYEGTGIGLAMCKKIVQNHHGHIYATSNPDGGAVFHVILPEKQMQISE
ncbi:PAS domain-containing protein [Dyadobacter flavalbus]|uniref:histidine kinase n=1 Tax=Dyadobacter flavalbus TaxID=2579942 RepID=A0A5M8QKY3_9BACT|nr:PAS domain-containing sensor histidine kinase [Dyadobacter flavalbus]KAA6436847.1 PAS domain-containing protein [Dyadobacter flavalbus]